MQWAIEELPSGANVEEEFSTFREEYLKHKFPWDSLNDVVFYEAWATHIIMLSNTTEPLNVREWINKRAGIEFDDALDPRGEPLFPEYDGKGGTKPKET